MIKKSIKNRMKYSPLLNRYCEAFNEDDDNGVELEKCERLANT